jgi:hypothetical protein
MNNIINDIINKFSDDETIAQDDDTDYDLVMKNTCMEYDSDTDDEIKDDEDFDIQSYVSKYMPKYNDIK